MQKKLWPGLFAAGYYELNVKDCISSYKAAYK